MVAAVFVMAGVIWLVSSLAAAERVPRAVSIRKGDTVRVQAQHRVFVTGTVIRLWVKGQQEYVEVADASGVRYIRPLDLVGRVS